jgi:hypothetical protein
MLWPWRLDVPRLYETEARYTASCSGIKVSPACSMQTTSRRAAPVSRGFSAHEHPLPMGISAHAERRPCARTAQGLQCERGALMPPHGRAQVRREVAAEVPGAFIPPIPNWDSNVITPGTVFMAKLAASLREYLCRRLATHPHWQHIQARADVFSHILLSMCRMCTCCTSCSMCTDWRSTQYPRSSTQTYADRPVPTSWCHADARALVEACRLQW